MRWSSAASSRSWLAERRAGRIYRLPTEAEWEYACRGGTTSAYNFGDIARIDASAWHKGNSAGRSHEVGQRPANPFGLYDISGNVWEWCSDFKAPYLDERISVDPAVRTAGPCASFAAAAGRATQIQALKSR